MLNLPSIIIDLLNPFAPCFYGIELIQTFSANT